MKIGLMIYNGLEQVSGGYLYDRMLVRAMRRRGHSIDIMNLLQRPYPDNISDNFDSALWDWMREQDIVVQDELCHPSLFLINERVGRPRVVALVHNLSSCLATPAMAELSKVLERNYLKGVDAVVCTSRATLEACRSLCPSMPPATVICPGKDHLNPQKKLPETGVLRILHVGNIHPNKGLDVLLEALSQVTTIPFCLEVVGGTVDAAFRRRLDDLIGQPLRKKIRFLGEVSPDDIGEVYQRTDILIAPSRYEGYGIALLEAMGFGIPVIASLAGGAGELVTHGQEGFLVQPGDNGAIVEHIYALANDEFRETMGQRARKRWEELPTWSESMDQLIYFLEHTVS